MHALRKAGLALVFGATAVTALAADLPETLARMRAAHGGAAWGKVGWLRMDAQEANGAMRGTVSMVVDRGTGQFVRRSDFRLYRNADGIDAAGRWRQDSTRGFHPLDSDEARAVAASESWLNRRGYLDSRDQAAILPLSLLKDFDVTFDYRHGLMTIAPSRPLKKSEQMAVD